LRPGSKRVASLVSAVQDGNLTVLVGEPGIGKRILLLQQLTAHGKACLQVDCATFGASTDPQVPLARLIAREARLLNAMVVLVNLDALIPTGERSGPLLEQLLRALWSHGVHGIFATSKVFQVPPRSGMAKVQLGSGRKRAKEGR
jgi:hypothetical protein